MNEPKSGQEEVCVHFKDLHGFDQVVLADDVLNTDLGTLDFTILGRKYIKLSFEGISKRRVPIAFVRTYIVLMLCKIEEILMKISLLKFCHSFSLVVVPSKKYLNVICDLFPLLE